MASNATAPSTFAELHYYSGGLRHYPVPTTRPAWAPPPDWVGFRDEFTLHEGTFAVEFRRLDVGARAVTWIAVYTRSVDQKFGDRGNHAGAGIWLCDQIAVKTSLLLGGLRQIAERLAADVAPETIADNVATFVGNFVPGYVAPLAALPPELAGLPFAAGQLTETARFVAEADASGWERAADKLAEVNLLGDHPGVSRLLIALTGETDVAGTRLSGDAGSFGRLLVALPPALQAIAAGREAAVADATRLRERTTALEASLQTARASAETAAATAATDIAALRAEAKRYDRDFTPALATALDRVVARSTSLENAVNRLAQQSAAVPPSPFSTGAARPVDPDPDIHWSTVVLYTVLTAGAVAAIVNLVLRLADLR